VLAALRNARGGPSLRVRVLAALLVLGLAALSAPALIPVLGWLLDQVW